MTKHVSAKKRTTKVAAKTPAKKGGAHAAQIYSVQYGAKPNALTIDATAHLTVGHGQTLASDLTAMVPYQLENDTYLLTYSAHSGHYDIYKIGAGGRSLTRTGGGALQYHKSHGDGYTILVPFVLGGVQYMVAYEPKGGHFDYFALDGKAATSVADYNYAIGLKNMSEQFTEIDIFNIRYNLFMLAYNRQKGSMIIFQLSVPPIGPKIYTVPYINESSNWAPGWVRFACFQWGGENFFLKTNIQEHAVNIDHVFDEPLDGTHPVGDDLPLDQNLTAVAPFYHDFAPYFLTFQGKTGAVTFNRFHSDALGWTQQACNLASIPKNTTLIVPLLLTVPVQANQKMRPDVKNTATYIIVY